MLKRQVKRVTIAGRRGPAQAAWTGKVPFCSTIAHDYLRVSDGQVLRRSCGRF